MFTASVKSYAEPISQVLDPDMKWIDHRLYREHCIERPQGHLKDLRIFANRDANNIVIVDNSLLSFADNLDRGIPVPSFYGQPFDDALLRLIPFLKSLAFCDNLPAELHKRLGLARLRDLYNSGSLS